MAGNNGLKLKLSKLFQIVVWILSLAFAAGMIWSAVQANTSGIAINATDIKDVNEIVNEHSVSFGKMNEFKKHVELHMEAQTKNSDMILKEIIDLNKKMPN